MNTPKNIIRIFNIIKMFMVLKNLWHHNIIYLKKKKLNNLKIVQYYVEYQMVENVKKTVNTWFNIIDLLI